MQLDKQMCRKKKSQLAVSLGKRKEHLNVINMVISVSKAIFDNMSIIDKQQVLDNDVHNPHICIKMQKKVGYLSHYFFFKNLVIQHYLLNT